MQEKETIHHPGDPIEGDNQAKHNFGGTTYALSAMNQSFVPKDRLIPYPEGLLRSGILA
jgi:hypothetical protein